MTDKQSSDVSRVILTGLAHDHGSGFVFDSLREIEGISFARAERAAQLYSYARMVVNATVGYTELLHGMSKVDEDMASCFKHAVKS